MHWMDRIGVELTRRPRIYEPIFSDGWGNVDEVAAPDLDYELDEVEARSLPSPNPDLHIDELRFAAPEMIALPHQSRTAFVKVYRPRNAHRMIVLLAAFNDHGYATRDRLAPILAERGIAASIVEAPLYGRRRPRDGQVIRSVSDFLVLGSTAVTEAVGLTRWWTDAGWRVGFGGYSMGGSMAAYAAALIPDLPVAVAPMAAAYSPSAVYVDAVLSAAVAWSRLGSDGPDRLHQVLDSISTLTLPPPPQAASAVLLAAAGDGYVPLEATTRLADHWHGSEVRVVPGGHASLLRRRGWQAQAIADAFDRFEAWQESSAARQGGDGTT